MGDPEAPGMGHNFEQARADAMQRWDAGHGYKDDGNEEVRRLKDGAPVRLTSYAKRDRPELVNTEYTIVRTDQIPNPIQGGAFSYVIRDGQSNEFYVWDYLVELDLDRA